MVEVDAVDVVGVGFLSAEHDLGRDADHGAVRRHVFHHD